MKKPYAGFQPDPISLTSDCRRSDRSMRKLIERLLYSLGKTTLVVPSYEVDVLRDALPDSFRNRDVVDIGCGDGGFSLILREVLESRTYRGVDSHVRLVACARRRGLDARILDVENQDVSGDLGVLWGVLHHLESPVSTLKRISNNFKSLIIRECIDERRLWEIGHKLSKEKLMRILSDAEIGTNRYEIAESVKTRTLLVFVHL